MDEIKRLHVERLKVLRPGSLEYPENVLGKHRRDREWKRECFSRDFLRFRKEQGAIDPRCMQRLREFVRDVAVTVLRLNGTRNKSNLHMHGSYLFNEAMSQC